MKLFMTLVERREILFKGKPQVKMTFIPAQNTMQTGNSKLTLFLTVEQAEENFPTLSTTLDRIVGDDKPVVYESLSEVEFEALLQEAFVSQEVERDKRDRADTERALDAYSTQEARYWRWRNWVNFANALRNRIGGPK